VPDPWNDELFYAHDKPVTLRELRYHANRIANGIEPWTTSTEEGLAKTILSLCDEIDRLHREAEQQVNDEEGQKT